MKLILALVTIAVTGCAVLQPAHSYDATLYNKYVRVTSRLFNVIHQCVDSKIVIAEVNKSIEALDEAMLYEKYRNEPKLIEATLIIRNDLSQMSDAYAKDPQSETYCKLKLNLVEEDLVRVLESIGGKPQ